MLCGKLFLVDNYFKFTRDRSYKDIFQRNFMHCWLEHPDWLKKLEQPIKIIKKYLSLIFAL